VLSEGIVSLMDMRGGLSNDYHYGLTENAGIRDGLMDGSLLNGRGVGEAARSAHPELARLSVHFGAQP
jgi:hypothetical protein